MLSQWERVNASKDMESLGLVVSKDCRLLNWCSWDEGLGSK